MSQFTPDPHLEDELRAALRDRAEEIVPTDRWKEIEMNTPASAVARRWPIVLTAAAAVLAVAVGGYILRPDPQPTTPSTPSPSVSLSQSPTPSTSSTSAGEQRTIPVYVISPEALGWPESGLGLRRTLVPAQVPDDRTAIAKAALVEALNSPMQTEGGMRPWQGVGLTNVTVTDERIDVVLDRAPTTDVADNIARLAVQQLAWTAREAGMTTVPVHLEIPGQSRAWSVDLTQDFVQPPMDQWHEDLTDVWITEPAVVQDHPTIVPAGQAVVVKGEATVFEANVQWRVTRADGTVAEEGLTTASVGAPDRGSFEFTVKGLVPGTYTIRAFSQSMKDGQSESANDEVTVTVQ